MSSSTTVEPARPTTGKRSYGQVLKSSVLIGASSVASAAFGIVRTKAIALLLGPTGIGLFGLYNSIIEVTRSVAGVGLNSSGVRQIAEAAGSGDAQRLARTATALRRLALYTGLGGSLLLLVLCKYVSRLTFGDEHHAGAVALLSLAVLFGDISAAQTALVQGMRRIADLARINVLGSLAGTIFGVVMVYLFGEPGLASALVCVGGMAVLTSWWYARKTPIEKVRLGWRELKRESSELLRLGLVFMAVVLIVIASAYVIRVIIARRLGMAEAGYYQAAWALGGLYVGFILQAMGADFYPRLTAVANDNQECNRLVNEQAEVSLLLAGPGIMGMLAFAPLVIHVFYSAKFGAAVEILRWFCLGMMLRVASWPMSYILLAKGSRNRFFWSELSSSAAQVGLVWVGIQAFGLAGAGMAFFGGYAFYWCMVYGITRGLTGFRWSAANQRIGAIQGALIVAVFVSGYWLPPLAIGVCGGALALLTGFHSAKRICALVPLERLPRPAQRLLAMFGMVPQSPGGE